MWNKSRFRPRSLCVRVCVFFVCHLPLLLLLLLLLLLSLGTSLTVHDCFAASKLAESCRGSHASRPIFVPVEQQGALDGQQRIKCRRHLRPPGCQLSVDLSTPITLPTYLARVVCDSLFDGPQLSTNSRVQTAF